MFLWQIVPSWLRHGTAVAAAHFLSNTSVAALQDVVRSDTTSEAARAFVSAATVGGEDFWLDVFIICSVVIVLTMVGTCVVRCAWWFCIGLPHAAYEVDQIRAGKKPYQVAAKKEREERQRRVEAGEEERGFTLQEDMQQMSKVMASCKVTKGVKPHDGAPAAPQATASDAVGYTTTSRRGPNDRRAEPSSVIRGCPGANLLITSPGQKYMLISCRTKRKTLLYPQNDAVAFMKRGKELQERHFTSVDAAVMETLGMSQKPEVYAASFSQDDRLLIVGERFLDTFVCFSISSGTTISLNVMWTAKLPQGRLVSSLPRWTSMSADAILSLYDTAAEVEVLSRVPGQATFSSQKEKFKVGSALSWAVCDDQIAIGGSFLKEARVSKVVRRATGSISLESIAIFPNPEKLRVSALAFVMKGAPEFNTRSYLVVVMESGVCKVLDLDTVATHNTPEVRCTFTDSDYAGYRSTEPLRIITAVRGKPYHEVLRVGLVRGASLTVYEQSATESTGCFSMQRVADLYDLQEGDAIHMVSFIQNGLGIASCGLEDGRHVRLFTLPSA